MDIRKDDISVLRDLAAQYMEFADSPRMKETIRLWYALNELHMEKPMITIDQVCWNEFMDDPFLHCVVENEYFRGIEKDLRETIYKCRHMPVDTALPPYIILPRPVLDTGYGLKTKHTEDKAGAASFLFEDQIMEMEDIEKIKTPVVSLDREKADEIWETAERIFEGVAPIRWGGVQLHAGMWDSISQWKGVENCYIDLLDNPELIHAILERYTKAILSWIDQVNALGIYDIATQYTHCSYTWNHALPGPGCDADHATTKDGWCFSMAQLFTSVSPKINEEFELPYSSRILEKFGSVYYGCCERLDDRLDVVTRMPNIRKISCSPWSDRENFAAKLDGTKYIMSNKPNPAFLAGSSFDEDLIRQDLRRTMKAAKDNGVCLEFLMKDISTVNNDPERLWRWARIAREETANW